MDETLGTLSSRNIPSRFDPRSLVSMATPVALPAGRLRLATRPIFTGSPPTEKTIGVVAVAYFAASATDAPPVAISTATPWRRRSSTIAGNCSKRFSRRTKFNRYVLTLDQSGFV